MVPLLPVIAISYQAEGVAIWLCQTQFLGNSEAVLPMLYSVTGSTWRQSLNTAVVQEAMSWYLEYHNIWFIFILILKVFLSINHKTFFFVNSVGQCNSMSIPRHLGKPRHELWSNDKSRTPVYCFKSSVFVLYTNKHWLIPPSEQKVNSAYVELKPTVCVFPVVWMTGGNTNVSTCLVFISDPRESKMQGFFYTLCQLNHANFDNYLF